MKSARILHSTVSLINELEYFTTIIDGDKLIRLTCERLVPLYIYAG